MKKLIALFIALISFSFAAEEPKADPIVGVWRGFAHSKVLEFNPDGTFTEFRKNGKGSVVGTWKNEEAPTRERKYTVTWQQGHFIYTLSLNPNTDKLNGKSSTGAELKAERVKS